MQNSRIGKAVVSQRSYQVVACMKYPKRFSGLKITQSLQLQLKDAVGASMSFAGSALSGNVNSLAVGIYEELDR